MGVHEHEKCTPENYHEFAAKELEERCEEAECLRERGSDTKALQRDFWTSGDAPGTDADQRFKQALDYLAKCPTPPSNGAAKKCIFVKDSDGNICKTEVVELKADDPEVCPTRAYGWDYVAIVGTLLELLGQDLQSPGTPPADMECPVATFDPDAEKPWPDHIPVHLHPMYEMFTEAQQCGDEPPPPIKGCWIWTEETPALCFI